MKVIITLLIGSLAVGAAASNILLETFEASDGINEGSLTGQNGWTLSSGTATVQSNVVQTGTQALEMSQATIMHDISSTNNSLWIRFQARIGGAPESVPSVPDPNTSVAFFVNTNLNIVAYSNNVPIDLSIAMPTHVWTRFDVYCDYDLMVWNLSMNGTTIAAALPLYSNNNVADSVLISNNGGTLSYFDQLDIRDHELAANAPDFDGDKIPDWWELKNFGGITAVSAAHSSGNPGMTYLETYLAGVSPFTHDPFILTQSGFHGLSWSSTPSRRYDIQWASSLLTNFATVASVNWPVNEYIHTPNLAEPVGFYRLKATIQ